MSKFDIFFTVNDVYMKYLSVSIASILFNAKPDEELFFHILGVDISEKNKRKLDLLKTIKDFEIEYIKVDSSLLATLPDSPGKHISKDTNLRLFSSSIKPDIDRALFLDADLVVMSSLTELFETDMEDNYIGCVRDQVGLMKNWKGKFQLANDYVNTGVILMNLKKWREDNIEQKFVEILKDYQDKFELPDQDTLNIACSGKVKLLSPVWNVCCVLDFLDKEDEKISYENPAVMHWASWEKPWAYPDANYAEEFWKYARMTPFYEEIIYANNKESINKILRLFFSKCLLRSKYYKYKLLSLFCFGERCMCLRNKASQLKKMIKNLWENN